MTYIILIAGKGSRLNPITNNAPKTLFKLDNNTTVLKRMVNLINRFDKEAQIVLVTGFKYKRIEEEIKNCEIYYNPFFNVTNSIASLWLARERMDGEITIINGDVVTSTQLAKEILTQSTKTPLVLMDSSIKTDGDYNVQVDHEKVVVMSKDLSYYDGEYVGITKLDPETTRQLKHKIEEMVDHGYSDQWYENALVEMIFYDNLTLRYIDIAGYQWTEVDSVNDLLRAKQIHYAENAE
ncbi:MAG: sugar phosphate nucleotidyltransferase [Eubacterium sp.]